MLRILPVIAAILGVTLPAAAQTMTPAQANLLEEWALATVIDDMCPLLKLDQEVITQAIIYQGIPSDAFASADSPYKRQTEQSLSAAKQVFAGKKQKIICAAGLMKFGPDGESIKGLLVPEN